MSGFVDESQISKSLNVGRYTTDEQKCPVNMKIMEFEAETLEITNLFQYQVENKRMPTVFFSRCQQFFNMHYSHQKLSVMSRYCTVQSKQVLLPNFNK